MAYENRPEPLKIQGNFESITAYNVGGWCWDPEVDQKKPEVLVVANGIECGRGVAGEFRGDLKAAQKGDGYCAFNIPIPKEIWKSSDGVTFEVFAISKDLSKRFSLGKKTLKNFVLPIDFSEGAIGYVEPSDGSWVWGWCCQNQGGFSPLTIRVLIDGEMIRETLADELRMDLVDAGYDRGRFGFRVKIPSRKQDGQSHLVEVLALLSDGQTFHLNGSPMQVATASRRSPNEPYAILEPTVAINRYRGSSTLEGMMLQLELIRRGHGIEIVTIADPKDSRVEAFLESLAQNCHRAIKVTVICPGVSQPSTVSNWEKWLPNVEVIWQLEQEPYNEVAALNRFISNGRSDVVFVSLDFVFTKNWLRQIEWTARRLAKTATVCCAPFRFEDPCEKDSGKTSTNLARLFGRSHDLEILESTIATGSVVYLRREALDQLGLLDELELKQLPIAFADYSLRAQAAGYRNLFAPVPDNLKTSSLSRLDFLQSHSSLLRRYPLLPVIRNRIQVDDPLDLFAYTVIENFKRLKVPVRPRLLLVLHTDDTSGIPLTNGDLAKGLLEEYEPFVLVTEFKTFKIFTFDEKGGRIWVAKWSLDIPLEFNDFHREDLRALYSLVLQVFDIDVVHIRHFSGGGFDLPSIAKMLGIPVVVSVHDYHLVCPNVKLIDGAGHHCGGYCTADPRPCATTPDVASQIALKHAWVHDWRKAVREMVSHVDAWVTTSESTKKLFAKFFPKTLEVPFYVIEHGRDFPQGVEQKPRIPLKGRRLKLLALGGYDDAKGVDVLRKLMEGPGRDEFELFILGSAPAKAKAFATICGPYQRENVVQRIQEVNPDAVLILSVWPETYCHTMTEAWAAGYPVVASALGALEERIRATGAGWLVMPNSETDLLALLRKVAADESNYAIVREKVSAVKIPTVADMACRYTTVYDKLLSSSKVG